MTDVVWTRDALIANAESLLALDAKGALTPHGIGHLAREIITGFLDLVRDADPLPDADGWEPKVGDRVKLVKDGLSTVGAVGMEGVIKKIEAGQHPYLIELDEGLVYESHAVPEQYRLTRADHDYFVSAVRPAPSGPVAEETVKRIVPGIYGIVVVGAPERGLEARRTNLWLATDAYGFRYYTRSEVLAAAEILRQIGEAMEGK